MLICFGSPRKLIYLPYPQDSSYGVFISNPAGHRNTSCMSSQSSSGSPGGRTLRYSVWSDLDCFFSQRFGFMSQRWKDPLKTDKILKTDMPTVLTSPFILQMR